MLYRKELPKEKVTKLISSHYDDIYPVCREQVFLAKLEGKPFPVVTASLLPDDWDALAETYGIYDEGPFEDDLGIYVNRDVIWLTEGWDPNNDLQGDNLNLFIHRDQYKELK